MAKTKRPPLPMSEEAEALEDVKETLLGLARDMKIMHQICEVDATTAAEKFKAVSILFVSISDTVNGTCNLMKKVFNKIVQEEEKSRNTYLLVKNPDEM